MKRLCYIILGILAIMLCACGNNYDYAIYERPSVEFYGDESAIVLLNDYDSYKEYLATISEKDVDEEFFEELSTYDENFFEKEMLIVIVHWETSGSIDISLKKIVYEQSNIKVVLKRKVPEVGSCDMKDHGIIIRIPQSDEFSTVEYVVEE